MTSPIILPPNRFVGLHGHSGFSTNDGLGYPSKHIDFVLENGMDAWALTDHGNGNGHAHARAHFNKMKKAGKRYRQLYGVEFYFVPSLLEWRRDYEAHMAKSKADRTGKKAQETTDINADDEQGLVIENEEETKNIELDSDEWKRRYHLVVIAKNNAGLKNLFRLVKRSYKEGFYRFPRIDFEMLREHSEGLHVSTACLGGIFSNRVLRGSMQGVTDSVIQRELLNIADHFVDVLQPGAFNLELQFNNLPPQHTVNRHLIDLARKTGIPLVATADSHYPDPDKWQARELYKRLAWMGKDINQPLPERGDLKCELYPKNAQQMWDEYLKNRELYPFYEEHDQVVKDAIERTHDIAWQACEDTWTDTHAKLPNFDTADKTAFQQLSDNVRQSLIDHGLDKDPEYVERLDYELSDIEHLGHASYFLTMNVIFHRAKERTLLGPGRGSAPGSLVNYLLGITQIDPLPYKLLWSRFLGRHRVSWPDIDSDAGDRDVLIDEARNIFGNDAVIPVSNFNTLKLKSLVKDVAKFFNDSFEEVNAVTGPLQDEVMPHAKDDDQEKSVFVLKHEDCMKYSPAYKAMMEKYPDLEQHVSTLFMENRSIGRHAGGVLVAPEKELAETMPIIAVRGELQTPWTEGMNFRNLEDNGFLKFDFLGLTLLKDVENCIRRVLSKHHGVKDPTFAQVKAFFDKHLNCRNVKQDDPAVWKHVYHEGRFVGVFQFTASGARQFCLEAKPDSIDELAALTAIYRPGPLKANVHKLYVKAKQDAANVKYDHPVIKDVLSPTFGYVVFQEQFMLLAEKLAGFTPGEADQLRKTLVKKSLDTMGKKSSEKETAMQQFVEGAKRIHGVSEKVTVPLWETIEAFSVYGFNKSHSVSYAIDSYYAAWLHTHFETDWLATILESATGNPDELAKTISEIKEIGYKFSPADINYSGLQWEYSEQAGAFVPPLTSLKGVGDTAVEEVMANRPYLCLDNLFWDDEGEWRHSKLNRTGLMSLTKTGALCSLREFRDGTLKHHRSVHDLIDENYEALRKGRMGMTPTAIKRALKKGEPVIPFIERMLPEYAQRENWTRIERVKYAMDLTSMYDIDLLIPPALRRKFEAASVPTLTRLAERTAQSDETEYLSWFCALVVNKKTTKKGKPYLQIVAIDTDGKHSVKVWSPGQEEVEPFSIWMANLKNGGEWGFSTFGTKLRRITVADGGVK